MIEINNLTFSYKNDNLLKQINTRFSAGNIYGLLGENGVGKSTLLKLITGLLFPKSGNISVNQHTPSNRTPSFLSDVFLLSENVIAPNMTGANFISIKAPFYPKFDHDHFKSCIDRFNIPVDQKLNTLSLGQQKKFFLSFGIACNTQLLMLDEPTNGLDIPSKGLLRQLIAESINEDQTVIISSHQVHDIEALIDAIVVIKNGAIIFNKTLEDTAKNVSISLTSTVPEAQENLIFSEARLGGYANLWKDNDSPDGKIDIELLFKAINTSNHQMSFISQES